MKDLSRFIDNLDNNFNLHSEHDKSQPESKTLELLLKSIEDNTYASKNGNTRTQGSMRNVNKVLDKLASFRVNRKNVDNMMSVSSFKDLFKESQLIDDQSKGITSDKMAK